MRLFLQLLSVLILLWGLTESWHAFEIANQEFLNLFVPSVTYGFESRESALVILLTQSITGMLICLLAMAMFLVTVRNRSEKKRKTIEYLRRFASGTARFAISFLVVSVVLFPVWMLIDASFQSALTWARYDLFIPDETGRAIGQMADLAESILDRDVPTASEKVHGLSELGPRILVMIALLCGTALSFVLGAMYVILNRPSKRYIILFLVTVIVFSAIIHQYENLTWVTVRHRITSELPRFQNALSPLLQHWPTKSGVHPELGEYFAHESKPGEIFLRNNSSYGMRELIGSFISKLPDGGASFSLEPHYLFSLEYHPPNHVPLNTLQSKYWTQHLVRVSEIEKGWYLTKYKSVRKQQIQE